MDKDLKDRVRDQFGRTADAYIAADDFAGGEDLQIARELVNPNEEDLMLDVATGGGHTALFFAPLVKSVVASDLTIRMLKKAQEFIVEEHGLENVLFREGDAEDLPFPSGAFTLLTCRIAPHHFLELERALSEFHRVLRYNGQLVIVDTLCPDDEELAEFQRRYEQLRDPSHHRTYRRTEWEEYIDSAGFIHPQTRVLRKSHDFDKWAARASMEPADERALQELFLSAPKRVAEYFQIRTDGKKILDFSDEKLLIYARKPPKK